MIEKGAAGKRLGLFGGTFNPIHIGHIRAAQVVADRFQLDQILFIPSYQPPHKTSEDLASAEHRLNMVRLALAGREKLVPSSIEIEAGGKSYSIWTLERIQALDPGARVFFILGIDAFLEIETWKDYKSVLLRQGPRPGPPDTISIHCLPCWLRGKET